MIKGACAILFAVCLFWPLGRHLLTTRTVSAAERERLAREFVTPDDCFPEPGERLTFQAAVVVVPVLLAAFCFAGHFLDTRPWFPRPAWAGFSLELLLGAGLLALTWYALRAEFTHHLQLNLLAQHPRVGLLVTAAALVALWWLRGDRRYLARLADVLAVVLIVGVSVMSVFGEREPLAMSIHFVAVFDPVVRVQQGKDLLIDAINQYGLYPHFLKPVFALVGLSVLSFTLVMSLLMAVALGALWIALRRSVRHPLAALLGFAAVGFSRVLFLKITTLHFSGHPDPYFQVFPVRLLFPALAVGLSWWYGQRPSRWRYGGITILLAAGVLWNFEAGFPAQMAWGFGLVYADFAAHGLRTGLWRLVRHLGAGVAATTGVIAVYAVALFAQHGEWPHFAEFFAYQRMFYVAGFYMMPMPSWGAWVLVILIYLAGLAYAALALAGGRADRRAGLILILSVLGIGLFPYYQGRSHPYVLVTIWWPCFLLMALFLDDLLPYLRRRPARPLGWVTAGLLAWALAGSAGSLFLRVGDAHDWIANHFRMLWVSTPLPADAEAALLRQTIPPGEEILAFSFREPYIHLHSGVPSVSRQPLFQLLLVEDVTRLCRTLEARPSVKIFIDRDILELRTYPNQAAVLLIYLLQKHYRVIDQTPSGYLFGWRED